MNKKKSVKKRSALGRGLGALLDDSVVDSKPKLVSDSVRQPLINEIPLKYIKSNPFQPRTDFDEEALSELADSIITQGIIQPITVRRINDEEYQLISGERRLIASKKAKLKSIPAYVREANDQQMLEMALIENIQRENLNAIEIATSYQKLLTECNLKQEELGDRVGKKRTTVTNYLRLLKLPPDIQEAIREDKISMGHARALINIENIDVQLTVFHKIIKEDLSVRKTEDLVRKIDKISTGKEEGKTSIKELSTELKNLQTVLSSHFGTKVEILQKSGQKGDIKIPYMSVDDLNRILEILEIQL
jgi:ParB family chromosome partitioning protein